MDRQEKERVENRYGIGEWYGRLFTNLSAAQRRELAAMQKAPRSARPKQRCPWRSTRDKVVTCSKEGGVCSLRLYCRDPVRREVWPAEGPEGMLCTTCPGRFYERGLVFQWVGEAVLGHPRPRIVREIGFLERTGRGRRGPDDAAGRAEVARIDHVLVHPDTRTLRWCALEMQAVYFSGARFSEDFATLERGGDQGLPFPQGKRRPDFRSSGPKRLMPQLQVKVPALRRWAKKMCVVLDRSFYDELAGMEEVDDLSSCDIAWFVVRYDTSGDRARLERDVVHITTLERAVEGLTAGRPVSQEYFENQIREKLKRASIR